MVLWFSVLWCGCGVVDRLGWVLFLGWVWLLVGVVGVCDLGWGGLSLGGCFCGFVLGLYTWVLVSC